MRGRPVYCLELCFLKLRRSAAAGWSLLFAEAGLPAEEPGPGHTVRTTTQAREEGSWLTVFCPLGFTSWSGNKSNVSYLCYFDSAVLPCCWRMEKGDVCMLRNLQHVFYYGPSEEVTGIRGHRLVSLVKSRRFQCPPDFSFDTFHNDFSTSELYVCLNAMKVMKEQFLTDDGPITCRICCWLPNF